MRFKSRGPTHPMRTAAGECCGSAFGLACAAGFRPVFQTSPPKRELCQAQREKVLDKSVRSDILEYWRTAMTAKATTPKLPALTDLEAMGQAAECLKTLAHPHRL